MNFADKNAFCDVEISLFQLPNNSVFFYGKLESEFQVPTNFLALGRY